MEQELYLKNLTEALKDLRNQGIIGKRDSELEKKLGYHKSTLSSYINGKINISEPFIRKFKNAFHIDLANYRARSLVTRTSGEQINIGATKNAAFEATFEVVLIKIAELSAKLDPENRPFSEFYLDLQTEISRAVKRRSQLLEGQ